MWKKNYQALQWSANNRMTTFAGNGQEQCPWMSLKLRSEWSQMSFRQEGNEKVFILPSVSWESTAEIFYNGTSTLETSP